MYCPPITIRCVDCRNFGRFILVGTHVINNVHKFFYNPPTKAAKFVGNRRFYVYNYSRAHMRYTTIDKPRLHDNTGLTTGCIVYSARCQTGCTACFDNRLNIQWLFVEHGCQTIQPVVNAVVQPVWQPAVSCKRGNTVYIRTRQHDLFTAIGNFAIILKSYVALRCLTFSTTRLDFTYTNFWLADEPRLLLVCFNILCHMYETLKRNWNKTMSLKRNSFA